MLSTEIREASRIWEYRGGGPLYLAWDAADLIILGKVIILPANGRRTLLLGFFYLVVLIAERLGRATN
jgi:hypothetical protein